MNNTDYFLSWQEFHRDTRALARVLLEQQEGKTPWKGIISIARGGLVPGAILARELNLRIVDTLCISSYDHTNQGEISILKSIDGDGEGYLLVDDLVDTGNTAKAAKSILPAAKLITVYAKPQGKALTEMYVREFDQNTWLHFPWDSEMVDDGFNYSTPLAEKLSC